ncbi:MAG: GAF domain-containing protein [Chloroflexi bacterium]|nr:GAF domain-containing protein [Chloroflexota bacterium]
MPDTLDKPGKKDKPPAAARFDFRSRQTRAAFVLLAWVVYGAAFSLLFRIAGPEIAALSILPVAAAGWFFGAWAGLLTGLLAFPLNILLITLAGDSGWEIMTRGAAGSLALVLVGLVIGRLRDLGERAKWELAQRMRAEAALQQSGTLITALSRVATRLQISLDPDQVMETMGTELKQLGVTCLVTLLDSDDQTLVIRYGSIESTALTLAEKLTGHKLRGFRMPPQSWLYYAEVVEQRRALFLPDVLLPSTTLLPEFPRPVVENILHMVGLSSRAHSIVVPLVVEERTLGVLMMWGEDLQEGDIPAVSVFAGQMAGALYTARLYRAAQNRIHRLNALNTIASALNNTMSLDEALRVALAETLATLDLPAGWISLHQGGKFRLAAHQNLPPALADDDCAVMRRQPCNCQRKILAGELPEAVNILNCQRLLEWATGDTGGLTLHASIPIRMGRDVFGMLNLATPPGGPHFDEDDLAALSAIGHQLAVALARARFHAETVENLAREQRLNEMAQTLSSTLDLPIILQNVARLAAELAGADAGAIALVAPDGQTISYPYLFKLPKSLSLRPSPKGKGVAWGIVESGEPLLLPDYGAHPNALPEWIDSGVRGFIGVPIAAGEGRLGAIGLFILNPEKRFTQRDLALAESVGRQAGVAIQNARLFEETQRQAQEAETLRQAGAVVAATLRAEEAIERILQELAHVVPYDSGSVQLLKEDYLEIVGGRGWPDPKAVIGLRFPVPGNNPNTTVIQQRAPHIVANAPAAHAPFQQEPHSHIQSWLGVPLIIGDRVIGMLAVDSVQPNYFTPHHARLVAAFADQVAVAIENARLFEALQHSEAYFRAIIENAWDGVLIMNSQGVLRYASPSAERIIGYQQEELVGRDAFGFLHPDDVPAAAQTFEAIRDLGQVSTVEARFRHHDGSWRILEGTGRNLLSDPRLSGIVVNYHDITERKQAEQSLRRRAAELESLSQVSSAMRAARNIEEMIPLLIQKAAEVVGGDASSIFLREPETGEWVSRGWLSAGNGWQFTNDALSAPRLRYRLGEGITGYVAASGEIYITNDLPHDPVAVILPAEAERLSALSSGISLPLLAQEHIIGVIHIWMREQRDFTEREVRLLIAIAEMAGNAIHRATLYEQTEQRLQRLTALHAIDLAISASLDLHLTLNVLLNQITAQVGMKAAAVLLFNPYTQTLEYAARHGFRTGVLRPPVWRLGEGYVGRAALERCILSIPDVSAAPADLEQSEIQMLASEGFLAYYAVPLVTKGQVKGVLEIFHHSPLASDAEWLDFLETLAGQAAIAIDNIVLFNDLQRSNVELAQAYDSTLEGWARALELRDKETEGHTRRVTELTLRLALAMGLPDAELVHVRRGALLHDIGKMGIPDSILLKPGPLTGVEWGIMRRHPTYAYEMLSPIAYLRPALDIPYCHHEKWDGAGYPRGLKGEQIPLAARIFAVVDVWDALCSDRPYRKAWPLEQVREHIRSLTGAHFDPQVAQVFLGIIAADHPELAADR